MYNPAPACFSSLILPHPSCFTSNIPQPLWYLKISLVVSAPSLHRAVHSFHMYFKCLMFARQCCKTTGGKAVIKVTKILLVLLLWAERQKKSNEMYIVGQIVLSVLEKTKSGDGGRVCWGCCELAWAKASVTSAVCMKT